METRGGGVSARETSAPSAGAATRGMLPRMAHDDDALWVWAREGADSGDRLGCWRGEAGRAAARAASIRAWRRNAIEADTERMMGEVCEAGESKCPREGKCF